MPQEESNSSASQDGHSPRPQSQSQQQLQNNNSSVVNFPPNSGQQSLDVQQQQQQSNTPTTTTTTNDENVNSVETLLQASELQRRRTEALERILLASDSNLSLPPAQSNSTASPSPGLASRRVRLAGPRRIRAPQRSLFNRALQPRSDLERAIFIPFRARTSMSALNLPTTTQPQDLPRAMRNLIGNAAGRGSVTTGMAGDPINNNNNNGNQRREEGGGFARPRVNVSTFFMELTYSTAEPHSGSFTFNPFKSSAETQKRKMEIYAANTMALMKLYCPVKLHKLSQFRCCIKTQRPEFFNFKNIDMNPFDSMDPTQVKCNTKVIVIVKDEYTAPGKTYNPFTSHLVTYLRKKRLNPTCLTFQSDACLSNYIEQLNSQLHAFPKKSGNTHDPKFSKEAKGFLVMSLISRLMERWNVPILILDSWVSKTVDLNSVSNFAKRFNVKLFDIDPDVSSPPAGNNKERKAGAKRVARQIRRVMIDLNMQKIRENLGKISTQLKAVSNEDEEGKNVGDYYNPTLISDDCRRIVFNLHERMTHSLHQQQMIQSPCQTSSQESKDSAAKISLLEDGILADIENSDAFRYPQQQQQQQQRDILTPKSPVCHSGRKCVSRGTTTSTTSTENKDGRPRTGYSISDDEIQFRDHEKVSELLFNELNQRWRVHGPQRFIPRGTDSGPYCEPLMESEKQLLVSVIQEVTNFEVLKDIRNELKDSKKDLEGRLYGYNPDFANLIASAEEFLHGKASCLEPCQEEMDFYKMPVSLVYSEAEVKYMKMKPPLYVVGSESPSQVIRAAMEESTKLFLDAVVHTTCGARRLPTSCRHKTKAIVVIEDNNEVLELLTVALWFFEKTPLATFQAKFCHNTPEFLLSLDACRFYYGTFPVGSTKKDDEHLYERWLGVGMNGILRSLQSKILLIDFPRPGTNLQSSKNILFNRLKLEEKLHNIKSFMVGRPSRKEDNLSTVENVLDEIQKCLEPSEAQFIFFERDKLLFRKARRMYLDLKLYKQIEQKSRQDLKSNRDWGIPEPDAENEHELWERLRSSEVVVNEVVLPPTPELITSSEIQESSLSQPDQPDTESNVVSDEDFSETHYTRTHSCSSIREAGCEGAGEGSTIMEDEEFPSHSLYVIEDHSADDDKEEEIEDLTVSSLSDQLRQQHYDAMRSYHSSKQRNIAVNTENEDYRKENDQDHPRSDDSGDFDADHEGQSTSLELNNPNVKSISEQTSAETVPEFSHAELIGTDRNAMLTPEEEDDHPNHLQLRSDHSSDGIADEETIPYLQEDDDDEGKQSPKAIKRSAGLINIMDGQYFDQKMISAFKRRTQTSFSIDSMDEGNFGENFNSGNYTRLEFTLAPKITSSSATPSDSSFQGKVQMNEAKDFNSGKAAGNRKRVKLPFKSKSLQETCKAYLHKWGKSMSSIFQKPKPRRIFPERLIFTTSLSRKVSSKSFIQQPESKTKTKVETREVGSGEPSEARHTSIRDSTQSGHNSKWLRLGRIFKREGKKSKT